jgi:hypothetical protein
MRVLLFAMAAALLTGVLFELCRPFRPRVPLQVRH